MNFDPATTPPPSTTLVGTGAAEAVTSGAEGSSESGESSNGSDGDGDSTNVGAIAGGVVGGVVGLGLIAALIVWIVLRHRRQSREAAWNRGGGKSGPVAAVPTTGAGDEKDPKSPIQATSPLSPIEATEAQQSDAGQKHEIAPNERRHELNEQRGTRPELP